MSDKREYRVIWKREGLQRRTKLYQTLGGAKEFAKMLREYEEVRGTDRDPFWEEGGARYNTAPPLELGPVIEERPIGEWLIALSRENVKSE